MNFWRGVEYILDLLTICVAFFDRLECSIPVQSLQKSKSHQDWFLLPNPRLKKISINNLHHEPKFHASTYRVSDISKTPFWSSTKKFASSLFTTTLGSLKSSRTLYLRFVQITSLFITSILVCILVNNIKSTAFQGQNDPKILIDKLNFESWITSPLQKDRSVENPLTANQLFDLKDFHFVLNNASKCSLNPTNGELIIILIHSAPNNFKERQAIRSSWGSVQVFKGIFIRLVFLLGAGEDFSTRMEQERFGDIVSGNFIDSYRNLTYKHLMGYKWALRYCSNAKFVLKTDDDAFVDMFQLIGFVQRTFGDATKKSLICNVFPEGTRPLRIGSDGEGRIKPKWLVTKKEYPYEIYPKYCSGLAYLATPDVLRDLLTTSSSVKYLWIDDVFVTGIVRDLAGIEPFYLNLRYSYDAQEYRKWLTRPGHVHKINISTHGHYNTPRLPFMFAHLERGQFLGTEMRDLWDIVSLQ